MAQRVETLEEFHTAHTLTASAVETLQARRCMAVRQAAAEIRKEFFPAQFDASSYVETTESLPLSTTVGDVSPILRGQVSQPHRDAVPPPPCQPPIIDVALQQLLFAPPTPPPPTKECDPLFDMLGSKLKLVEALPALPAPVLGSEQLPTIGSATHHLGGCRPCAFYFTRGCGNAEGCPFCHLCGPGEKKKRLRDKRIARREAKYDAGYGDAPSCYGDELWESELGSGLFH